MSSSSEAFSDVSSRENHWKFPIKVNVSSKILKNSEDLNVRKEMDEATSLGLKRQSNTTSKISHALEVLKKYDNKYKIKPSEVNKPNFIDTINSPRPSPINIPDKSMHVTMGSSQRSTHVSPGTLQILDVGKLNPTRSRSSEDTIDIRSIAQEKTSRAISKPDSLPEVIPLSKGEDYESDFESTDSESLYDESDPAKEIDSSRESEPGSRHRPVSTLSNPNLHSPETESSIHTVADKDEFNVVENVGVFNNMRLFTFSDLGSKTVKKIDGRRPRPIEPLKLKDTSTMIGRLKSDVRAITNIDIPNMPASFDRTVEILSPSASVAITEKSEKSSDYESIPESLTNSSMSDDSSIPFRHNIYIMDDLDGADSIHPTQVALTSHGKENNTKLRRVTSQEPETQNVVPSVERLSTSEEDIEEIIDSVSDKKTEQHKLTYVSRPTSLNDGSYESDYLSDSEMNSEKSLKLGPLKSNPLLTFQHDTRTDARNEEDPPAKRKNKKVKDTRIRALKSHLRTRDVSMQTELLESGNIFSENLGEERHKVTPSQFICKPLNLSWDFDSEERDFKSTRPFILNHQTLTPQVIEALANQKPAEDALDEILRQQIALTKIFMASQYKMYQTYCTSVHQLTTQYTPVTLEETKEFIKMHKKMRTNRNDQQVF